LFITCVFRFVKNSKASTWSVRRSEWTDHVINKNFEDFLFCLLLWKFDLSKWSLYIELKVKVKSQTLIITCVKTIIIELYNHYIHIRYIHFKSKISIVTLVWPWNIGQTRVHSRIHWVWLPITCQYYFLL
jgi:hypothetical protein